MNQRDRNRQVAELRKTDPFVTGLYIGVGNQSSPLSAMDVESRLDMVREFNQEQCRAALKLDIQKTVRTALERRLRKLEKEAG